MSESDIVSGVASHWDRMAMERELAEASARLVEQADELTALRARVKELEGQHKGLVLQNALLRQRPDLPVDRIPAADDVARLRAKVEKLEGALRVYAGPVGGNDFPHWSDGYPGGVMVDWNTLDYGETARAALGDTHE